MTNAGAMLHLKHVVLHYQFIQIGMPYVIQLLILVRFVVNALLTQIAQIAFVAIKIYLYLQVIGALDNVLIMFIIRNIFALS